MTGFGDGTFFLPNGIDHSAGPLNLQPKGNSLTPAAVLFCKVRIYRRCFLFVRTKQQRQLADLCWTCSSYFTFRSLKKAQTITLFDAFVAKEGLPVCRFSSHNTGCMFSVLSIFHFDGKTGWGRRRDLGWTGEARSLIKGSNSQHCWKTLEQQIVFYIWTQISCALFRWDQGSFLPLLLASFVLTWSVGITVCSQISLSPNG